MDGAAPLSMLSLDPAALDPLMPMHVWVSGCGRIVACGPTMHKLFEGRDLIDARFLDVFELRRPSGLTSLDRVKDLAGQRLFLTAREGHLPVLRGVAAPLSGRRGVLFNLSFGIGLIDAVRRHGLTDADFAPTDLAVELLYVVEAKTAVMDELRALNLRLQGAKIQAEEQAQTDTLTGLRNRRALDATMRRLIAGGTPFGLMHLDLDFFKLVNDTLGHAAGDHVLRCAARVLTEETRTADTVARVGGDEFVILLPDLADPARLLQVANRIIGKLGQPIDYIGQLCRISGSIGMTISTAYAAPDAARMIADADRALYASKHAGRGVARMHDRKTG